MSLPASDPEQVSSNPPSARDQPPHAQEPKKQPRVVFAKTSTSAHFASAANRNQIQERDPSAKGIKVRDMQRWPRPFRLLRDRKLLLVRRRPDVQQAGQGLISGQQQDALNVNEVQVPRFQTPMRWHANRGDFAYSLA